MNLSGLKPPAGQKRKQRRVGRGMGSGRGKTAGRGQKGQLSVSGFGQKRGFHNIFKKEYAVINVGRLVLLEGDEFSPERLVALGIVKSLGDGLKVLGSGEVTRPIQVKANLFSKSALEKIQAAGGSATLLE
jgi:large subunit ribosomal protein L15